ncbi:MAG: PepSY-associated TM helix domain-containing protein [Gordonia paraffinivorans]
MSETVLRPLGEPGDTSAHRTIPARPVARRRRRRRRAPVRRFLVVTHRWSALLLGLVLVVVCTSGAALVYEPEIVRTSHSELFHSTPSVVPVGFDTAFAAVRAADPDFATSYASLKDGVYLVFSDDPASNQTYYVDAGTGRVNGHEDVFGGVIGFLVNLHDCGLTCQAYPGYLPWLDSPSVIAGVPWFADMTWGAVVLGGTGLLLLFLAVGGIVLWWPGIRRWRQGFRVRLGKGRFARDYDLHNVIGIVAAPALLVWALTGMNFEIPEVSKIWYAATGGVAPADDAYTMESSGTGPQVDVATASSAAVQRFPHASVTAVSMPTESTPYYTITLFDRGPDGSNADLWANDPTYSGNRYVGVDAHDASHVSVMEGPPTTVSNTIIDNWAQPVLHYGVAVGPWWRSVWFAFGLTPLALMLTGVSTWVFRRQTARAKKKARAARAAAAA